MAGRLIFLALLLSALIGCGPADSLNPLLGDWVSNHIDDPGVRLEHEFTGSDKTVLVINGVYQRSAKLREPACR